MNATDKIPVIVSGHQPVYLPWLGLLHKAWLADIFVFMDDVQYLTGDWNNRNRIKVSTGKPAWLTVPVDLKNSKSMMLADILIADEKVSLNRCWQNRHWKAIRSAYGKAPYFKTYAPFFEWLYLENRWHFLADLNLTILHRIFEWFQIKAKVIIGTDECFKEKKSDLVLEHALRYKADIVVTGALGRNYIKVEDFQLKGVGVHFQEYNHPTYQQRYNGFISHLSFIDLLFNAGPDSRFIFIKDNVTREDLWSMIRNI